MAAGGDPRSRHSHGPLADRAPDLVLVSRNGWDLKGAVRTPSSPAKGRLTGMHTQDDAFVLVRGAHPDGAVDVQDVAATALDGLGIDASGLDGRVLVLAGLLARRSQANSIGRPPSSCDSSSALTTRMPVSSSSCASYRSVRSRR